MDGYREEENSGKYHWLTYKWLLELSPKPVNHRNSTVVFKGIWKFSKNRMQERNTFISIALKISYCHYWVSPSHSVVSVGTKQTRKAIFQWLPDYQRPLCEVFPSRFLNPSLIRHLGSHSPCVGPELPTSPSCSQSVWYTSQLHLWCSAWLFHLGLPVFPHH